MFAALGILAARAPPRPAAGHGAVPRRLALAVGDVVELARPDERSPTPASRWLDYSDLGSRYSLYRTADGHVALAAPSERRFWEPFVDLVGLPPEWKAVRRLVGQRDGPRRRRGLRPRAAGDRRKRLATPHRSRNGRRCFAEAEIPFAPILSLEEAMDSEHARVNGVMRSTTMPDGR